MQEKIARLPREVDIYMRQQLREMLSVDDCRMLVIDLRDTRYIDGASIGEIVRARNLAVAEGKKVIVLLNRASPIVRVFRVVQLFDILDVRLCDDRESSNCA